MNTNITFSESKKIDLNEIATFAGKSIYGASWTLPKKAGKSWTDIKSRQSKDYPFTFIPIKDIEVYDATQRNRQDIFRSPILRKMCSKFDSILFMPCRIALYVDDNGIQHLINVDGQGRQIYGLMHGFPSLPCIVQKVGSWDEVCQLFFKYNNQNNTEKVTKSKKWQMLYVRKDPDALDDYERISTLFTGGVQIPGDNHDDMKKVGSDVFTEHDFTEFVNYGVTFKEDDNGNTTMVDKEMPKKLMFDPYFKMRSSFPDDGAFKHWGLGLSMIYKAVKRLFLANADVVFRNLFVNGVSYYSLPNKIQFDMSLNAALFLRPTTEIKHSLLHEDYGIKMLELCKAVKIINPKYLVKKSKQKSTYEQIINTLKNMKKSVTRK